MKTPSGLLRGSMRAVTGAAVVAAAVVAVVAVSTVTLPEVQRPPEAVQADARTDAQHDIVCAGSFEVLGADPERPTAALPVGEVARTIAGDSLASTALTVAEPGGSAPLALVTQSAEAVAAAQSQRVNAYGVKGLTAAGCVTPVNEQWLVGGSTELGTTTTLVLNNPSDVPATVRVTLFDADGQVDSARTSGVLVAGTSQRTVSLNGYAPAREQLVARLESSGAAVTAQLNISAVSELDAFAADTVTRQIEPVATLFLPGVTNPTDRKQGPGDAGDLNQYPVRLRVLAPAGESGSATAYAVFADGGRQELATVNYQDAAVVEQPVAFWPAAATGVVFEADDPIVAGVLGSSDVEGGHDYSWFAPAPELHLEEPLRVPVVADGTLVIMNPHTVIAEVTIVRANGVSESLSLPAGAARTVAGEGALTMQSALPLHAGVRVTGDAEIASYPVTGLRERLAPFEIFVR